MATFKKQRSETPCGVCGKTEYEWGIVRADQLAWLPDSAEVVKKVADTEGLPRLLTILRARRCEGCGNVQLFAD